MLKTNTWIIRFFFVWTFGFVVGKNITIVVLLERSAVVDFPFSINRTRGLISMAINRTQELLYGEAELEYIIQPVDVPECVAEKWGSIFAELYYNHKPHLVIGPGCTPSVQTVSRMAAYWKIPHITYVGLDESLGNKREFSTLTRSGFTINMLTGFYIKMLEALGYTYVANIYDTDLYVHNLFGTSLQATFKLLAPDIHSFAVPFNSSAKDLTGELLKTLRSAATQARVFLVFCHGDVLRQMVLKIKHTGLTVGEFVFIFMYAGHGVDGFGEYTWYRGDNLDQEARQAYQSVLLSRILRPPNPDFSMFEQEVKDRALLEYNYTWNYAYELELTQTAMYDSFLLYAHALKDCLAAGEDPRDGEAMVKRMWNRTFQGIGGTVFINENGDRVVDFGLRDLNPITGDFRVVGYYMGWKGKFEFKPNVSIHWPGTGVQPPNIPPCGFTGELCTVSHIETSTILAISFSCVIVLVFVTGFVLYRRVRRESLLMNQWWRVQIEDIKVNPRSSFFSASKLDEEQNSMSLRTHVACVQSVGIYKGAPVHITRQKIKSLVPDRKLLLELKQMREITCPNLARLIGLCIGPEYVSIVTEYCSRGNLQDILHNESIQLDWDFRISLINDIVEGMYYLHSSPVGVHGRLNSVKCVIDSRFVLKITGYGLNSLADLPIHKDQREKNGVPNCRELFWMAPEHLRVYPTRTCSQPGDVYSFAIIMYEMCTRSEPYVNETWYTSVEETLTKIQQNRLEPVRPTLVSEESCADIAELARYCWREFPIQRPTFFQIKKVMKMIKRKRNITPSENVLDVLLRRMEQYANNLEGLVEERTQAFLEEKKKSEELLYQVLPKSVANQLRSGTAVSPEAFDSVTVYFSDIVGFTSISAQSSPFEVVDLLNDLYTCFDTIIGNYDVYKVETIGDAYMVVSGLPERNGSEHVRQIARLALNILHSIRLFTIRHMPDTPLQARIGLHSGSVCAGVVGLKMPRYCLFGDTVNTASRMESHGEAMKIHISEQTKQLLAAFHNFVIKERGLTDIKGKGPTMTYWLVDEVFTSINDLIENLT